MSTPTESKETRVDPSAERQPQFVPLSTPGTAQKKPIIRLLASGQTACLVRDYLIGQPR
jgi:hypothetical protein